MPNCKVAGRSLYVRSFYGDLLRECLKHDTSILLGNPGVSKSVLQMVILAGLLAPPNTVFPKDSALHVVRECLQGINVVIRQRAKAADIFFLDERKHLYIPHIDSSIFSHFDPTRTLYLFEPADTTNVSPFGKVANPKIGKTLATLSPRESRYKEFAKQNHAITYYMPLYTEDQLVAIGLDMSRQADFPEELRELYTEDAIRERFKEFGGVIRSVLLTEADKLDELRRLQQQAIDDLTPDRVRHLLLSIDKSEFVGTDSVSHKLILLDAAAASLKGKFNFRKSNPCVIGSPALKKTLRGVTKKLDIEDKMTLLRRAETWPDTALRSQMRLVYQDVIAHWLTTNGGMNWMESPMENKNFTEFHKSPLKLADKIKSFDELGDKELVFPDQENFPFADMYYKDKTEDQSLVCVQVWFGFSKKTKDLSLSSMKEFKEIVKSEGIKLVLAAPHSVADEAEFKPTNSSSSRARIDWKEFEEQGLKSKVVWKPPSSYDRSFHLN